MQTTRSERLIQPAQARLAERMKDYLVAAAGVLTSEKDGQKSREEQLARAGGLNEAMLQAWVSFLEQAQKETDHLFYPFAAAVEHTAKGGRFLRRCTGRDPKRSARASQAETGRWQGLGGNSVRRFRSLELSGDGAPRVRHSAKGRRARSLPIRNCAAFAARVRRIRSAAAPTDSLAV